MNGDVVKKLVDLHQKIDPHHDMGIPMNSDSKKKPVDLHQKIDLHHDMGIRMNSDIVTRNPLTSIRKLTRIMIWVYP